MSLLLTFNERCFPCSLKYPSIRVCLGLTAAEYSIICFCSAYSPAERGLAGAHWSLQGRILSVFEDRFVCALCCRMLFRRCSCWDVVPLSCRVRSNPAWLGPDQILRRLARSGSERLHAALELRSSQEGCQLARLVQAAKSTANLYFLPTWSLTLPESA